MEVERYNESHQQIWDQFVDKSKNGTFLFRREYMDYHQDRFEDHSLLIRNRQGELLALLPANCHHTTLHSHAGLTYGGFITGSEMKLPKMLEVFEITLEYLRDNDFQQLLYKTIPFIYHRLPAEEDRYALFLASASLVRRGCLLVCSRDFPVRLQDRRKRGVEKATQSGLACRPSDDWDHYWNILSARLRETYGTSPVHSVSEIQALCQKFPEQIKLFTAFKDEMMLAGVVIYETERVAHAQYIAANDEGRELGALDLIFHELLATHYKSKSYFDFGTSDEQDGRALNRGLVDHKEGFGARTVVHDHYRIDVADWKPGQFTGAMR